MQSKGAKIGFIILLLVFGGGVYWMFNYGPMADQAKANQEAYKNYVKAEAIVTNTEHNGKIGKGSATVYTLEFTDATGTKQTVKHQQDTFLSKEKGDKVTIYYDSENPNAITSEESYNKVMN